MRLTRRILLLRARLHVPLSFRPGFALAVWLRRQRRIDMQKIPALSMIASSKFDTDVGAVEMPIAQVYDLPELPHSTIPTTQRCVSYGIEDHTLVHMVNWLELMLGIFVFSTATITTLVAVFHLIFELSCGFFCCGVKFLFPLL
jgi:hypothetical protein